MILGSPLTDLKGVGEQLSKKLAILGVKTVGELIDYYPRRYDDYSHVEKISEIRPGPVSLKAKIIQVKGRYVRRGMHITEAVVSDATGSVRLVWFNQPYRAASLKTSEEYYISGEFGLNYQRLSITNPSIELVSEFPVNTARIVPVYRETKGLKSAQIRKALAGLMPIINSLPESLPSWLVRGKSLYGRAEAVEMIHFPNTAADLEGAKKRLGFEEVFCLSLAGLLNKKDAGKEHALSIPFNEKLAKKFVSHLPFTLTDAQRRTVWQIYLDMQKEMPMNRLIEGDVGSGKTVVATMAAVMAMEEGFQVSLMAPTEILAKQHAETIYELLKPLGLSSKVGLLVGSLKPKQKSDIYERLRSGEVQFIIGTHAVIQEKVNMSKLGLVIIDEQHRFGVIERKKLLKKAGHAPHVISMTATPIPRSLALTLYGEMDVSIIGSKPVGRIPIITELCSSNSSKQAYQKIDKELAAGRQMFVVCPLINPTDMLPVRSAEEVFEEFSKNQFKKYKIGLLHGKMKALEKNNIMQQFIDKKIDILVSTTVIEVGVNVPNASVMMIMDAERFGLAQIHQLRGRVGRSDDQGYCFLMLGSSQPSRRLRAIASSNDGFKLAELDLELRGPGAIYGTMQHGQLDLRVAKLTDFKLIQLARSSAQEFIDKDENLLKYKKLLGNVNKLRAVTNLN